MPILSFDFESVQKTSGYPKHGWARNSQQLKLLWFPILSLVRATNSLRQSKGVTKLPLDKARPWMPFYDAVRNLIFILREISSLTCCASRKPYPV
jgi:hypothetical protein